MRSTRRTSPLNLTTLSLARLDRPHVLKPRSGTRLSPVGYQAMEKFVDQPPVIPEKS